MRRYELMLVIRPDVADDKSQALIDRTTRGIVASGGQIVKVAPWGRRRLAYPIDRHREGSYHIILFEAPSDSIVELEHTLLITEEVLRHLVTRVDRPAKSTHGDGIDLDELDDIDVPSGLDDEDDDERPPRVHRRVRERGGSGRHRLTGGRHHGVLQDHDHRQPRARSRDALHADRPPGDPVQRGGQPQQARRPGRLGGRGDRLVPRQRLR